MTYACSLCAPYTRSHSDRAVIDPTSPGNISQGLQGFTRHDGGGGNRTRDYSHLGGCNEGREPRSNLVTLLVRRS